MGYATLAALYGHAHSFENNFSTKRPLEPPVGCIRRASPRRTRQCQRLSNTVDSCPASLTSVVCMYIQANLIGGYRPLSPMLGAPIDSTHLYLNIPDPGWALMT